MTKPPKLKLAWIQTTSQLIETLVSAACWFAGLRLTPAYEENTDVQITNQLLAPSIWTPVKRTNYFWGEEGK